MFLETAQKVIVPQKKIMSRIFLNSRTLIVILKCTTLGTFWPVYRILVSNKYDKYLRKFNLNNATSSLRWFVEMAWPCNLWGNVFNHVQIIYTYNVIKLLKLALSHTIMRLRIFFLWIFYNQDCYKNRICECACTWPAWRGIRERGGESPDTACCTLASCTARTWQQ